MILSANFVCVKTPIVQTTVTTLKVHVLGTGLVGSSIGLGLRNQGWEVAGWDPDPDALSAALGRGAITRRLPGPETENCDLVIMAAPPSAVLAGLEVLNTETLTTDVAGVKGAVVNAGRHLPHFVGGHPMAGGETRGARLASSSLFHGAAWVLTSDYTSDEDIESLKRTVESLGANPIVMTAAEHDAAVARVSHLPHVLAAILMNIGSSDPTTQVLAGGGFRDLTRIAASESDWWTEVLVANTVSLTESLNELKTEIDRWLSSTTTELRQNLESARVARLALGEHDAQIEVLLHDQPGEIARVGHALETSRVDVRDLQLRHGEHGGGGVLTISVRAAGRMALIQALSEEGFEMAADLEG